MPKPITLDVNVTGNAEAALKNINKETSTLAVNAQGKLTPSIMQSSLQLQSMSRIAQDSAYGIRGMGNNIVFAVEEMGRLKAQGIGLGAQFKGLIKSLAGPGGFIFAISAVTTIMTMMEMGMFSARKETDLFAEAFKNLADEMIKIKDPLAGTTFEFTPEQTEKAITFLEDKIKGLAKANEESAKALGTEYYVAYKLGILKTEELKQNQDLKEAFEKQLATLKARQELSSVLTDLGGKQVNNEKKKTKELKEQNLLIQTGNFLWQKQYDLLNKSNIELLNRAGGRNPERMMFGTGGEIGGQPIGAPNAFLDNEAKMKEMEQKRERMNQEFAQRTTQVFQHNMVMAWQSIFGEANSMFEQLMARWSSMLLEQVGTSIFDFIFGGFDFFRFARSIFGGNAAAGKYRMGQ